MRSSSKEKIKGYLLVDLRKKGVDTASRQFLKPKLIEMSGAHNIAVNIIKKREPWLVLNTKINASNYIRVGLNQCYLG